MSWGRYGRFKPYVSVATRRANAQKKVSKLTKGGKVIRPVQIEGRTIARTFWGKAWCENLEAYSDYSNRLPRGRTYVRNGSVVHLDIFEGKVEAMVSGSELYTVTVKICAAEKAKWQSLCKECAGGIGSLVELLQASISDRVMGILAREGTGLFPSPREIQMSCSCPDSAGMCKHLAAVLYGVGSRLDQSPELLFLLRSVDQQELISEAAGAQGLAGRATGQAEIADSEIGDIFGIEMEQSVTPPATTVLPPAKGKARIKATTGTKAKPKKKPKNVEAARPKRAKKSKS